MRPTPTTAQLQAAAERLGMSLDVAEAEEYRVRVGRQLALFHDFLTERFDESTPPVAPGDRSGGHRPDRAEDPLGAWAWKCSFRSRAEGLLAGRTVSFKDHISVAGIPQTYNSVTLDRFVPDVDATVVAKVLAAGGTVVGKNVFDGFADDYPKPVNPRDAGSETGGSSSGSAAAVAGGEVDVSIGGDQGGSVRIPAIYCGVMGLKPTFGLVSHFGATFGFEPSLDHVGPIARTAEDLARTLDAIAGYDGLDPRQGRAVPLSYDSLSTLDDGIAGVRVGVLDEGLDPPIDAAIRESFMTAVSRLAGLGAEVSRVSVPMHRRQDGPYAALAIEGSRTAFDLGPFELGNVSYQPMAATTALTRATWDGADRLPPRIKANHLAAELARRCYAGAVAAKARNVRAGFAAAYDAAFDQVDVLLLPVVRMPPGRRPRSDRPPATLAEELDEKNWMHMDVARNTKPFNLTGHPALAMPCAKDDSSSAGIQLVARRFSDALLLRVAAAFERT